MFIHKGHRVSNNKTKLFLIGIVLLLVSVTLTVSFFVWESHYVRVSYPVYIFSIDMGEKLANATIHFSISAPGDNLYYVNNVWSIVSAEKTKVVFLYYSSSDNILTVWTVLNGNTFGTNYSIPKTLNNAEIVSVKKSRSKLYIYMKAVKVSVDTPLFRKVQGVIATIILGFIGISLYLYLRIKEAIEERTDSADGVMIFGVAFSVLCLLFVLFNIYVYLIT